MRDHPEPRQPEGAHEVEASSQAARQDPIQELLGLLELEYDRLFRRLSSHLHSPDIAAEALHDVYLKLRSEPSISGLHNPVAYLYRMAINLAKNRGRQDWRIVQIDDAVLNAIPDSAPDQEAFVLASDEMARALGALHALPGKRRAIFLARWRDEKRQAEIAAEFGLHLRSVQKELFRAEAHLRKVLRRQR